MASNATGYLRAPTEGTKDRASVMKGYKDKYKKLMALKAKNDEVGLESYFQKLHKAKKSLEALKNKSGVDLIKELNLVPRKKSDTVTELLEKKREIAMKGEFKLPKMRNYNRKSFAPKHNISTVLEEEDDEDFKSSGQSKDYINLTRDALKKVDGSKTDRRRKNMTQTEFNLDP